MQISRSLTVPTREEVRRADLNTTVSDQAVIAKIVQGTNVTLSSTGVDSGTGDVTINATGAGGSVENHIPLVVIAVEVTF